MCKHKIYNHQSYIYLICLGMKNKTKTKNIKNNNKNKNFQKNETINLTKLLYKTALFINLDLIKITEFLITSTSLRDSNPNSW